MRLELSRLWVLVVAMIGSIAMQQSAVAQDDAAKEQVPDVYRVKFETSQGDFVVEVHRDWAPRGADRFHQLVEMGYYDDARFFRAVKGFVVQWGMNADPKVQQEWMEKTFADDPVKESNKKGYVTFAAGSAANSRSTQVFVNLRDNDYLDNYGNGFPPIGKVVEGMDVVEKLYTGYGEAPSRNQPQIATGGNEYLQKTFPKLDHIKQATIVKK